MRRLSAAFAAAFLALSAILVLPSVSLAEPGTTEVAAPVTILIEYVDESTGIAVADPYKAVLAPGDAYSAESPAVGGYALVDPATSTVSGTANADATITVRHRPETSSYKVNHYFQTIDGTYVLDESATQTFTAQRNSTVTATPLEREGYTCVTTDRSMGIPTDGTVVEINLYYDRTSTERVIYFETDGSYVEPIIASAGSDISAELAERTQGSLAPTRQGYVFDGWESEDASYDPSSGVMPDHNVTLVAKWTPGTANYRVVYWCEYTYDHGSYYVGATETRSGTVGDEATFDYLSEEDTTDAMLEFEKADQDVTIAADGSSVVNVYYRKHTVHVIVYKRSWNMNSDLQLIESEQDLRVGDDVSVPTTESMVLFFDDDQLSGTNPDTIDGVWGENITMRWTYYRPDVTGSSMQSHMRYYSTQPYVNPSGVDTTTWELRIYPDYRYSRPYPFYMAYYLQDANTGEYELDTLYFEYRTDNSSPDNPVRTLRPMYCSGYSLKYVRYSTETYPANPSGPPSLGDFQEVSVDADGTAPEEQWYTQYYDPSNYIAFYYEPNDYALNYIVSGEVVHTESYPYGLDVGLDYVPTVPEDLAAQGYTFAGWYREGDGDQTIVTSTTINYRENDFVAKFQAPTYTVTFDLNGGTMSAATSQTVEQGATATEPDPAPVREGYSFVGWFYQDTNGKYGFDRPVNSDVDLIAMWRAEPTRVTYLVRHVLDTGEVLKTETRSVALWHAGYVSAFALDSSDAAYPSYSVVPDEVCKALLLPDSGSDEIVFVYRRTPTHTYTVRYLDQTSGLAVADDYVFEDIASIMTVVAPGFSGYVRLQDYGRGTSDATVITLYYRQQSADASASVLPSTGDDAPGMPWLAAMIVLGAGCIGAAATMSRRRDERL